MAYILVAVLSCAIMLILIVLKWIQSYIREVYKSLERKGIAVYPPKFLFGGYVLNIFKWPSIYSMYENIYQYHKGCLVVGLFCFWQKQILIRDPGIIRHVLRDNCNAFQERRMLCSRNEEALCANLFSLKGGIWNYLRDELLLIFSPENLEEKHPMILNSTKMLINLVSKKMERDKTEFEWQYIFFRFGLEVLSSTEFGLDLGVLSDEDPIVLEMIRQLREPGIGGYFSLPCIDGQYGKYFKSIRNDVSSWFIKVFEVALAERETLPIERKNCLDLFVDLKLNKIEGCRLNIIEKSMSDQALMFIVANSHAISSTMAFCLYELAINHDVQERLTHAVEQLPDLSFHNVEGCEYLDMVVSETLRKHPPVGVLQRDCVVDYHVPGTELRIDKGTQVVISLKGLQNDPELFIDPERFDPQRFSEENKTNIEPYSFLPFADGKRYCTGNMFSKLVVKTGLAALLRRYYLVAPTDHSTPLEYEPGSFIPLVVGGICIEIVDKTMIIDDIDQPNQWINIF